MATLLGIQTEYAYQLQDLGALLEQVNVTPTTDVRDRAIVAAINYYTRRLPRINVALVSALAGNYYPVPSDWVDHSRLIAVEFPLNGTPPIYYSPKAMRLVPRENDTLFVYLDPNPSGSFRLIYTAGHSGTNPNTICGSIPSSHEAVVGMIAASIAMREFADRMAGSVMANIDSVNYRSKSKEFTDAANALKVQFDEELQRAELAVLKKGDPYSYFKGWAT